MNNNVVMVHNATVDLLNSYVHSLHIVVDQVSRKDNQI